MKTRVCTDVLEGVTQRASQFLDLEQERYMGETRPEKGEQEGRSM